MTLDEFFEIGSRIALGSHTFEADAIKAFAAKWDPQPFHLDEELARGSVFGALCASGWHTASVWMRLNLQTPSATVEQWTGPGALPQFGPSPGIQNVRWPKPVYSGETVDYFRTAKAHRRLASRPGWRLLSVEAEGIDSQGDKVLEFECAVLVKAA